MTTLRSIRQTLETTGLPWAIVEGKKHYRILLCGRQVTVCSRGSKRKDDSNPRGIKNILAEIKRAARTMHGQAV